MSRLRRRSLAAGLQVWVAGAAMMNTSRQFPTGPPNYLTGVKGKRWGLSLLAALRHDAVVIVEETGEVVTYDPLPGSRKAFRPWRIKGGKRRFDHWECIPTW